MCCELSRHHKGTLHVQNAFAVAQKHASDVQAGWCDTGIRGGTEQLASACVAGPFKYPHIKSWSLTS